MIRKIYKLFNFKKSKKTLRSFKKTKNQEKYMILNKILKDQRAQISAEMIILLAAIIAIVLVIVTQLQKTTTKANKTVEKSADKVFDKISKIE
ncbi:MAG: hypothetical protein PHU47_01870 [Candidatus ainarchaeum sp.]|nr:hypothetical protein [Candidatus ainarchaeum sp.]